MMTAYILKLLVLVPLVAGLAFGALWLWRKVQPGMAFAQREKLVRLVDAVPLGATGRLAVVEFEGRRLLLSVSRTGVQLLADGRMPPEPAPAPFSLDQANG
jgi:flagellar protein FliO/FliZ